MSADIVKMFKTLFKSLWIEHLLYLCFSNNNTNIKKTSIKKFKMYCSSHDWDTELYIDQILNDDDHERNVKDMLINSQCGCGLCDKLKVGNFNKNNVKNYDIYL